MPKSNASNTPTDGNASQWEKVKEMRDRQAAVVAGEPAGTPIQVIGVEAPAEESPAPPAVEQPRNPDGTFAAKEPEAPPAVAAPPKEPEKPPLAPPAQPAVREITIDGVKV